MTDHRITFACLLLLCTGYASAYGEEQQRTPPSWEKYRVIVERNIFLRQRSSYSSRPEFTHMPAMPVDSPESCVVLTGIVRQGSEYIAFLENTRTGVTLRVAADSPYADGRVARIELDHIEYEKDDQTVKIAVGSNLRGESAAAPASSFGERTDLLRDEGTTPSGEASAESANASAQPGAAGPAVTVPTAAGAPSDEASILERLRQRRLKELNGK